MSACAPEQGEGDRTGGVEGVEGDRERMPSFMLSTEPDS